MSRDSTKKKEKSVDERIKSEVKRLNGILQKVPDETKKAIKSLIENAAFMTVTLEDLQKTINEKGVVIEYLNGVTRQSGKRKISVLAQLRNLNSCRTKSIKLRPNQSYFKRKSPEEQKRVFQTYIQKNNTAQYWRLSCFKNSIALLRSNQQESCWFELVSRAILIKHTGFTLISTN